ncbi:MAG TPA: TatD family hydrolase [Candidatus Acidoferrales bacterium]|nr:TatD family hydrolase [Candidatus Acidoferrales bacterium]
MSPQYPIPTLSAGVTVTDSHCHLDQPRFDGERDAVVQRALDAGVGRMITIGASDGVGTNYAAVDLAARHPQVFATVGVHPHDARIVTHEVLGEIETLAGRPKVVAIGETGLDYYYDNSPRDVQQAVFRQFIDLARRVRLPLSIHLRDAYDDAVSILREERADEIGGVIHCFSGDRKVARQMLDLNFDLSFSGVVTFKNAEELRHVAREVPAQRFMVETDAPFLTPIPYRGKRNEPLYVLFTAACLAEARRQSLDEVASLTRANTNRRFCLRQD